MNKYSRSCIFIKLVSESGNTRTFKESIYLKKDLFEELECWLQYVDTTQMILSELRTQLKQIVKYNENSKRKWKQSLCEGAKKLSVQLSDFDANDIFSM